MLATLVDAACAHSYTVGCSHRNTAGVVGFTIYVTSASASPVKIEERAARFLRKYLKSLARMSAATYAANVSSAVANTLRDDHSLQEEAQKDLSEIQACSLRLEPWAPISSLPHSPPLARPHAVGPPVLLGSC